jgi:DsbC/DsbD-like thiol-disulfide interchange protein
MQRWFSILACGALLTSLQCLPAQQMAWQSDAQAKPAQHQLVQYLYPEQVTIAAGKPSVVELHFKVNEGLHINSHTPSQKSLIATQLLVAEPAGVTVANVDFPAGSDYSPAFDPQDKLNVYTGEFVLRAHITAKPGDHLIQAGLRYQACDAQTCYPPKTAPIALSVIAK